MHVAIFEVLGVGEDEKMRLLDLFCGAGGCSVGYARAGFEIVGIDIKVQPRYPFEFYQYDAFEFLADHWQEFDIFSASPPCQPYSRMASLSNGSHPKLIAPLREMLEKTGKPYIIENVNHKPLHNPLRLTGAMFDLGVRRMRYFETKPVIWWGPAIGFQPGKCGPRGEYDRGDRGLITVAGHNFNPEFAAKAMNINWMIGSELSQAIPPAYTEFVGNQIKGMI